MPYDFEVGGVYDGDFIGQNARALIMNVTWLYDEYQKDWKEVSEQEEPTGLLDRMHKDTDLGYFAGLAMNAMVSRLHGSEVWSHSDSDKCIHIAQSIIRQLNNK